MDLASAIGIHGSAVLRFQRGQGLRGLAEDLVARPHPEAPKGDRCPADRRIEAFLDGYFADLAQPPQLRLPAALALPRHGIARELSLPAERDVYANEYVTSYRVRNGVLHNPRSDRRTTKGTFHVCEGGLPIPATRRPSRAPCSWTSSATPDARRTNCSCCHSTSTRPSPSGRSFLSCSGRWCVRRCPASAPRRRMEVRFFAPGSLVSNLDFVESIFGNAGDANLPENDAGLMSSTGPATRGASSSPPT